MSRLPVARNIFEVIDMRESLAHFAYPYLDQALDHPLVSHGLGFRGRAMGYMVALRLVGMTRPSETATEYTAMYADESLVDAVLTRNPEKMIRDILMAGRDAFRITVGAHLALRAAKVPRDERAEVMQNSPSILRIAGYTSGKQNSLLVPLPRPIARMVPVRDRRPYMTFYSVPPSAFELNDEGNALTLSPLFDQHIRAFRAEMRDSGVEKITGCPALTMKIDAPDDSSTTLLLQYWRDYVNAVYEGNPHEQRVPQLIDIANRPN